MLSAEEVVAGVVSMDSLLVSGGGVLLLGLVTIMTRNLLTSMLYDSNLLSSWRILPGAQNYTRTQFHFKINCVAS